MSASSTHVEKASPCPCVGFLTATRGDLGVTGGYLILNPAGRPLEFHCTAPVKASRVQEILYGPTLNPFLYGEQIGQTLVSKSRLRPLVVCTDAAEMLGLRELVDIPLALVLAVDAPEFGFSLGASRVSTTPGFGSDEQAIREAWPAASEHFDLLEPFTRIREALDEAQRSARQAA
jgi:hypothetical protein